MSDNEYGSESENKDDFSDVESYLNQDGGLIPEDDDEDLIGAEDIEQSQLEESDEGLSGEGPYEDQMDDSGSLPGEDPDEELEEEEEVVATDSGSEIDKKKKLAILGAMGLVVVSGAGFAVSKMTSAPTAAPQVGLESLQATVASPADTSQYVSLPKPKPEPQESGFQEDPFLADGDFDLSSFDGAVPTNRQDEVQEQVVTGGGADEGSTNLTEGSVFVSSSSTNGTAPEQQLAGSDHRLQLMLDEYAKEAGFVGSNELDGRISELREHLDNRIAETEQKQAELAMRITEQEDINEKQDVQIDAQGADIEALQIKVSDLLSLVASRSEGSIISSPSRKPKEDRPVASWIDDTDLVGSTKDDSVGGEADASPEQSHTDIPVDAPTKLEIIGDRERLPGFKILTTSDDGDMAIAKTPSGKVQVFFEGELLRIRGEGTLRVTGMHEGGYLVFVGDRFYFDQTYVELPAPKKERQKGHASKGDRSVKSKKVADKADRSETKVAMRLESSSESVEEPDYIIAEANPATARERHKAKVSSRSAEVVSTISPEIDSESSNLTPKWAKGWSVAGGEVGQNRFLVKSPEGRWHAVRPGQLISGLGKVKKMNLNGDLIVGEYRIKPL